MSAPPLWNRYAGPQDAFAAATSRFLRELSVAAAPQSVAGYLASHPAAGSLAAVIDGLAELGVRAAARRTDVEGLSKCAWPALALVHEEHGGSALWVVREAAAAGLVCLDGEGRGRILSLDALRTRFAGVVLTAEVEAHAGERYAERHARADGLRRLLPYLVGLALGLAALASLLAPGDAAHAGSMRWLLALSWLGLCASSVLSLRGQLSGAAWLARLCPKGKTFNCTAVLDSKAGQLVGVVPLCDVGAAFFVAQIVAGSLAAASGAAATFLASSLAAGALLVPFVVWALLQQGVLLRRFCGLCLLVHAVLLAQLALSAHALDALSILAGAAPWASLATTLDARAASVSLLAGSSAALGYAVARQLVTPALAAPQLFGELSRLRHRPEVLAAELAHAPGFEGALGDVQGALREGDPNAPLELFVVSHPLCAACADAHLQLRRLLHAFPGLVRSATIFSVSPKDAAACSAAEVLLGSPARLHAWYADVAANAERWVERVRKAAGERTLSPALSAQISLAQQLGVVGTPTIFVDGRALPPGFDLSHLRPFLRARQREAACASRPSVTRPQPRQELCA